MEDGGDAGAVRSEGWHWSGICYLVYWPRAVRAALCFPRSIVGRLEVALSDCSRRSAINRPRAVKKTPPKVSMRWPLRYQILFPFAGLFLAAIVAITAIDAWLAARNSQRRTEAQLQEIARTLLTSSFPLTDAVLRQTRGLSGTEFVVTSADGYVRASSIPVEAVTPVAKPMTDWQQIELADIETVGDERYFHTAIELKKRADRSEPGLLHILYPERSWREARWQAIYPPLVVGGVSLAAVGGLAIALAARLSRPIQSLQQQVGQLARGDFQTVELPARNDELRDLGASVNQLAEQLAEMRRVIKRSERLSLLGQLSGGLAHHLRNDVAGARIAIQLHEQECSSEDAETLAVALRQLTLAEQHLVQFLAAGQPRAPQRAACNLRELLEELVALVGPTFRHQNVSLAVNYRVKDSRHLEREIDAEQLRQALLNLVLNGLEAAGPKGSVRIFCDCAEDNSFRLCVFDSGPGVSPTIADRLFEPFTTSRPEGVGLGLTVARQIAEGHGGTLHYHRDEQTCFEIALPIPAHSVLPPSTTLQPTA